MAQNEIDTYLAALEEPKRSTLEQLRTVILDVVPDAGARARLRGSGVQDQGQDRGGLRCVQEPLELPATQRVLLAELGDAVAGYETSKGLLKFASDQPLSKRLVVTLITARMRELGMS
jgi:uncharacterized protein YdhG (YjbR/CyaY superfamily)